MNFSINLVLLFLASLTSKSFSAQICDNSDKLSVNITQERDCLTYTSLARLATNFKNEITIYRPIISSGFKLQLVENSKKVTNPVLKLPENSSTSVSFLVDTYSKIKNSSNALNNSLITNNSVSKLNSTYSVNASVEVDDESDSNSSITFEEKAREDGYSLTTAEENPYAVLLFIEVTGTEEGVCSGTILTEKWVLTAAHCLRFGKGLAEKVTVYAGGNSLQEFRTTPYVRLKGHQISPSKKLYPHPKYTGENDGESLSHDVGLVLVEKKFVMTKYVKTLKLSTEPWTHYGYQKCLFTGFGVVSFGEKNPDDSKRKTHRLIVKNPCLCNYKLKMIHGTKLTRRIVCPKPIKDFGICSGDSGGGLICDGKVIGTASMLVNMYDVEYCETAWFTKVVCGTDESLTYFMTVCPHLEWINQSVGIFKKHQISDKCVHFNNRAESRQPHYLLMIVAVIFELISMGAFLAK